MSYRTWLAALVCLGMALATSAPAAADFRVWEQNAPDEEDAVEEGEDEEDGHHRYFDVTAFIQPGYVFRLTGDDENAGVSDSTPWLQRARIGFRTQVMEWLRVRMEIEFAPVTTLQDAYVEFPIHQAFELRAGQFNVPFLRSYLFNELNLAFLDRPVYTPQSPDRSYIRFLSPRDIGFMVRGRVGNIDPEAHLPVFEYQVGAFLGRGANINRNDDDALLYAARFQLHMLGYPEGAEAENDMARNDSPRVALATGFYSNCDDRANWNRGFTVDTEFRYKGFYASGAFVWFRNSAAEDNLGDALGYGSFCTGSQDSMGNPLDFVSRGAHLQAQYVLPEGLIPLDVMALELLARFDWVDPNSPHDSGNPLFGGGPSTTGYIPPPNYTDSDNAPTRYRLTFGLNFYPYREYPIRFQVNYQLNREVENVPTSEGTIVGVKNDILWLQLTVGI